MSYVYCIFSGLNKKKKEIVYVGKKGQVGYMSPEVFTELFKCGISVVVPYCWYHNIKSDMTYLFIYFFPSGDNGRENILTSSN